MIDLSLYLVTDRALCLGRDVLTIVEESVKGGVSVVQLREKECSFREMYDLALKLKDMLSLYKIPLIINDRVDIALTVGADGVHLGQSDMHPNQAREILGERAIIGLSVESMEQVEEANNLDVNYLAISPVFATPTKTDTVTEWGIEGIKKVRNYTKHRLVAIGGINAANAEEIIKAGADGIAVVSAICSAEYPRKSAEQLRRYILPHLS